MTMNAAGAVNFEGGSLRVVAGAEVARGDVVSLRFEGDRPVTVLLAGSMSRGQRQPWMSFLVPRPFSDSAQFTTGLRDNAGRCRVSIRRADASATVGTFRCRGLVGAVRRGDAWLPLPRGAGWRLDVDGRFVLPAREAV
jgi:hypothetical protein